VSPAFLRICSKCYFLLVSGFAILLREVTFSEFEGALTSRVNLQAKKGSFFGSNPGLKARRG
jgi:hypothetical protein